MKLTPQRPPILLLKMPPQQNNNKRPNKQSRSKRQPTLECGRSYFDILPDGVLELIYSFKHQLEFNPILQEFKKIENITISDNLVDTNTGVLKLLKPVQHESGCLL